ncbi:MAG TPA: leucine-rich repeat domain-containing protein, partial [Bacteroidales bacterium]
IAFAVQATDFWSNNLRYSINPDAKSVTVTMRNDKTTTPFVDTDMRRIAGSTDSSRLKLIEKPLHPIAGNVVIPEKVDYEGKQYKVTIIGCDAFSGCGEILSITMPQSVTVIDSSAFRWCSALTSLIIPKSVTKIEYEALRGCKAMNQFVVEKGNDYYSAEDGVLFSKSKSVLIAYPREKAKSYTIPSGVTTIGDFAFAECNDLISLTIPESVTSIGTAAFLYTPKLDALTIPKSVRIISDRAFVWCGLTTLTIPESFTKIEDNAFFACYNLTSVTIPESVTSIGKNTFSLCEKLKEIHIRKATPPSMELTSFDSIAKDCILYVPKGSKSAYMQAPRWTGFKNIQEE